MALIQINFMSKSLMRTVPLHAIIPVDKLEFPGAPKKEKKPFKTLYLLHGIFGNYTDWATSTRIQRWAQDNDLAVIMPSGDNHFYVDQPETNEMYGEFIGKELVEFTRELFPLSHKREDTFIAGLSMGGYGALRNGLKYHDTFGYIGALSSALVLEGAINSTEDAPTFMGRRSYFRSIFGDLDQLRGSDKDYFALIRTLKEQGADIPKLYVCCGTEDFLLDANREYSEFLKQQQVDFTYEEGPGAHDWDFWDAYIKKFLDFLPLGSAQAGVHSGNVGI